MNLGETIQKSIYNLSFYKELMVTPLRTSLKFYFKFIAIIALVVTILLIPRMLVLTHRDLYQKFVTAYPAELQVTVQNGIVSTNVQEPYFIKNNYGNGPENAVVIDTKSDFTADQFDTYKTNIIVKKDFIAVKQSDATSSQPRLVALTNFPNVTITQAVVAGWANKLQSLAKYFIILIILGAIIGFYILFLFKLVYLFLAALIIWLIAVIMKKHMRYMKAYQLGIHAMVLPIIIEALAMIINIPLPIFIFSFIVFLIIAVNIKDLPNKTI